MESGYFETIKQHLHKVDELIKDCERYKYHFYYEKDKFDGYTNGTIIILVDTLNHRYEIKLLYDDRMWGYCECTPKDPGYDPIHNCCGIDCDWYAPAINIIRVENLGNFSFDGSQRDLWRIEREWNGEVENYKNEERKRKIQYIDEQIEELIRRKEMILNEE